MPKENRLIRAATSSLLMVASLAAVLRPATARAYEDYVALSVDAGYGYVMDGAPTHGVAAGFGVGIGLGDIFTLKLRATYGAHPGSGLEVYDETTHVLGLAAEAVYIVDILTWVPFFGAGVEGILAVRDGVAGNVEFLAVAGIDYLHSRELAFGLDVRVGYLPFEPVDDVFRGLHTRVTLRFSYLFSTW